MSIGNSHTVVNTEWKLINVDLLFGISDDGLVLLNTKTNDSKPLVLKQLKAFEKACKQILFDPVTHRSVDLGNEIILDINNLQFEFLHIDGDSVVSVQIEIGDLERILGYISEKIIPFYCHSKSLVYERVLDVLLNIPKPELYYLKEYINIVDPNSSGLLSLCLFARKALQREGKLT